MYIFCKAMVDETSNNSSIPDNSVFEQLTVFTFCSQLGLGTFLRMLTQHNWIIQRHVHLLEGPYYRRTQGSIHGHHPVLINLLERNTMFSIFSNLKQKTINKNETSCNSKESEIGYTYALKAEKNYCMIYCGSLMNLLYDIRQCRNGKI